MGERFECKNAHHKKEFLIFADELMRKNDCVVFEYAIGKKQRGNRINRCTNSVE